MKGHFAVFIVHHFSIVFYTSMWECVDDHMLMSIGVTYRLTVIKKGLGFPPPYRFNVHLRLLGEARVVCRSAHCGFVFFTVVVLRFHHTSLFIVFQLFTAVFPLFLTLLPV
jgi:hypothetical protein